MVFLWSRIWSVVQKSDLHVGQVRFSSVKPPPVAAETTVFPPKILHVSLVVAPSLFKIGWTSYILELCWTGFAAYIVATIVTGEDMMSWLSGCLTRNYEHLRRRREEYEWD
jgi:hypothetical protein